MKLTMNEGDDEGEDEDEDDDEEVNSVSSKRKRNEDM